MKIGLWIHPEELTDKWVEMALDAGLDMLGLHPAGGSGSNESLQQLIELLKDQRFINRIELLKKNGVQVEYACHALSWILPRSSFESHPEWFRLNQEGKRVPDYNCCPSNEEVLDIITERAALLTEILFTDSHRYHFWADDALSGSCHCHECRQLSPSDNLLKITHAVLKGIKKADSLGRLSYLAYHDTIYPPAAIVPEKDIFLEYAPMDREYDKPLSDLSSDKNRNQLEALPLLLNCFGTEDSTVLDYWMDNSLFSGWKKPPQKFKLNDGVLEKDVQMYKDYGFEHINSFACFLGDDYISEYNELPPVKCFASILDKYR